MSRDRRTPAPVNLKRIYICLLALTLTIGVISLAALLKYDRSFDALAKTYDPARVWIEELLSTLSEARTSFHRSASPPDYQSWSSGDLGHLITELKRSDLPFEDSFLKEIEERALRMTVLSRLTGDMVHRGQWEELQIIIRDFDRTSDELYALLLKEKTKIRLTIQTQEMQSRKRLRLTSYILGLSLFMSVLLTIGFYVNWRRFEGTVLGLEP